jgi:hypothetical protein
MSNALERLGEEKLKKMAKEIGYKPSLENQLILAENENICLRCSHLKLDQNCMPMCELRLNEKGENLKECKRFELLEGKPNKRFVLKV